MKLFFEILMLFVAFGSVVVLFATVIGLTIWALYKIGRALMDS